MSDYHTCPTCQAKTEIHQDPLADETRHVAVQDQDLIKKINQLKKMLDRKEQQISMLRAQLEAMEGAQILFV